MKRLEYKESKEKEIAIQLSERIQQLSIHSLTVDYSRRDGAVLSTYFRVFITATTITNEPVRVIDLSDTNKEELESLILFTRGFCTRNKLTFENRFANDGYTYRNKVISRRIIRPK